MYKNMFQTKQKQEKLLRHGLYILDISTSKIQLSPYVKAEFDIRIYLELLLSAACLFRFLRTSRHYTKVNKHFFSIK